MFNAVAICKSVLNIIHDRALTSWRLVPVLVNILRWKFGLMRLNFVAGFRFFKSSAGDVSLVVCGVFLYANRNLFNRVLRKSVEGAVHLPRRTFERLNCSFSAAVGWWMVRFTCNMSNSIVFFFVKVWNSSLVKLVPLSLYNDLW